MTRKPIPNPSRFDFDGFIDSIIELDFPAMFQALDQECRRVEASMTGRGAPQARADGGGDYVARLKRVGFWFHYGKPTPGHSHEVAACRRIAIKLIEKRQLKPEALDVLGR
jgi:hypothetical protein